MISKDKYSDMKEEYYTIKDITKLLKVSYITVYRWISSNKLEAYKAGKQYRILKSDLDKFITKN